MVTRSDLQEELKSFAEGIFREELCLGERPSVDAVKEVLQQELLLQVEAFRHEVKDLMRLTLREELPSHLRVFAQDSLRRELSEQLEVVVDALEKHVEGRASLKSAEVNGAHNYEFSPEAKLANGHHSASNGLHVTHATRNAGDIAQVSEGGLSAQVSPFEEIVASLTKDDKESPQIPKKVEDKDADGPKRSGTVNFKATIEDVWEISAIETQTEGVSDAGDGIQKQHPLGTWASGQETHSNTAIASRLVLPDESEPLATPRSSANGVENPRGSAKSLSTELEVPTIRPKPNSKMPKRARTSVFCLDQHLKVFDDEEEQRTSFLTITPMDSTDEKDRHHSRRDIRSSKVITCGMIVKDFARQIVSDYRFDAFFGILIILNAIAMGIQTDVIAQSSSEITPVPLQVCDMVFCVFFLTELLLRIAAYGLEFFYMPGWHWSWFDLVLVAMQVFEETVALIARFSTDDGAVGGENLSFLRVLRVFRLVRLVRLARILRFVRQLRSLVCSIGGSLQSLGWTVLLLVILMYVVAIYFTQSVSNHRHSLPKGFDIDALEYKDLKELEYFFGNLGRSILSLFEATSGGADWDNLANPLKNEISPLVCIIFACYIAFVFLAMLNVVTGVFVENALQGSAQDKETQLVGQLKEMFTQFDADNSGAISYDEFQAMLKSPSAMQTFRSFDVNASQAKGLFSLIDVEAAGVIDINAFIVACVRLRGTARAADMTTLMYELQRFMVRWRSHAEYVEENLAKPGLKKGPTSKKGSSEDLAFLSMLDGAPVTELERLVTDAV